MSTFLESKGIVLMEGYRKENIPASADAVVIGNAMKRGNPEVEAVLKPKTPLFVVARVAQEFLPARAPQSRCDRHTR
jgi:UDP-N-acetylmuramate: L-alanyl-gamma-D-glutamyl-meso-diaminopimelate ligase